MAKCQSDQSLHYVGFQLNFLIRVSIIAVASYWIATRFNGFWPTHTNWLFNVRGANVDASANYLGWEFFRQSPLLQWPITRITNLGPNQGSSVAMTDSLPLLAIIFKPILYWFHSPFQYFGLWIFFCFFMQAYFSTKLLTLWIKDRSIVFFGTFMFTLAPPFLDRMRFHLPLAAHFVIVASIFLYFREKNSIIQWLILLSSTVLIHPYLVPPVIIVFVAREISDININELNIRLIIRNFFLVVGISWFTAIQSGLFVFGSSSIKKSGFSDFSSNVLSLLDPAVHLNETDNTWSLRIPNIPNGAYQYEGFAFLGSGVIALILILAICQIADFYSNRQKRKMFLTIGWIGIVGIIAKRSGIVYLPAFALLTILFNSRKLMTKSKSAKVYVIAVLLLSIWSFSNVFQIGGRVVSWPIPNKMVDIASIFRTSGRFIWLLFYSTLVLILVSIFRYFRSRSILIGILALALVCQVYDSRGAIGSVKESFSDSQQSSTFQSALWSAIGTKYKHIVVVYPSGSPTIDQNDPFFSTFPDKHIWIDLGRFALYHHLSLNDFYFSRYPKFNSDTTEIDTALQNGEFDRNSLYIFVDPRAWFLAKTSHGSSDLIGLLDGLPILLPGLNTCGDCNFTGFESKA